MIVLLGQSVKLRQGLWITLGEGAPLQIVFHRLHKVPALGDERGDHLVTQFFIFPVVTALSEVEGLVDDAPQFFR